MRWVQLLIVPALVVLTSVTGGLVPLPRPTFAQGIDELWTQPRVVVDVRGPRSPIRSRVSRALRRALADEIGGLHSSRVFRETQRKLRIPPARRTLPSQLARVARHVGAEYVVFVRVGGTQRRPQPSAWGYLLSAKDGAILHKGAVPVSTVQDAPRAAQRIADAIMATLRAASAPAEPLAEAPRTATPTVTAAAGALKADDEPHPTARTATVTRGPTGPRGAPAEPPKTESDRTSPVPQTSHSLPTAPSGSDIKAPPHPVRDASRSILDAAPRGVLSP